MTASESCKENILSLNRLRSPYVHRYSDIAIYVNVQGWLTATTLATRAPGGKIVAMRFIRLIPSAFRVGAEPASLQAIPPSASLRTTPVSRQRLINFQPDRGYRFNSLNFRCFCFAV